MKCSIRQGCFETNSSSIHAIVIDTRNGYVDDYEYALEHDSYHEDVRLGEYGRPLRLEMYTTEEDRINYLWTAVSEICAGYTKYHLGDDDMSKESVWLYDWEGWEERIRKAANIPENVRFEPHEYHPRWSKMNDCDYRYWMFERNKCHYIDHDSDLAPLLEAFYKDEQLLKDFITGKDSFFLVSSDEWDFDSAIEKLNIFPYYKEYQDEYDKRWKAYDALPDEEQTEERYDEEVYNFRFDLHSFEDGKVKLYVKD